MLEYEQKYNSIPRDYIKRLEFLYDTLGSESTDDAYVDTSFY